MSESIDVVVIGGGQAGLATSYELTQSGVEHVVLERAQVGESWRKRWDSFHLVTPNWSVQLPGHAYDGSAPDGYMARDEVVAFLERYAAGFEAPVREGVEVTSLEAAEDGGFVLQTSAGEIRARSVVVATGGYQRPHRPSAAGAFPAGLLQIDADEYRNEASLPEGQVLIIGSGQTGCQIAEELVDERREVFLSCGRAAWAPRRIGDHDVMWWAVETGYLDEPFSALPSQMARLFADMLGTGHDRGRDLDLRTLRNQGVTLLGRFRGATDSEALFSNDLYETVTWGDQKYREFRQQIRELAAARGIPEPDLPEPGLFSGTPPESIELENVGVVIFAGGYRPDFKSWVQIPKAIDYVGFPVHEEGQSTVAPGLFFVGVHFLRKRKSALLYGVGEDAAIVAGQIAAARTA